MCSYVNLGISLFSFGNVGDSEHNGRNITVSEQVVPPSTNKPSQLNHHSQDVFTLSQISPRKDDSSDSAVKPAPQSPTPATTGGKRLISAISDLSTFESRKKAKTAAPVPVRRSSKPNLPALQPSMRKNAVASSSRLPSSPHSGTRMGLPIRQAPVPKGKDREGPTKSGAPGHSCQPDNSQKPPKITGDQRAAQIVKSGTSSAIREQVC
jgi:hypothetical protein